MWCSAPFRVSVGRPRPPDDLWRLLVTITARKAAAQWKRQCAQKRGGGAVRGESALESPGQGNNSSSDAPHAAEVVPDRGPTPDMNILVAEECERLLDLLDDPLLQKVAVWKLEGYTNAEIAQKLGMAVVSVERKLARIRKLWEHREQTLPQA
jgi:DNA-directed RNA polymerase specialized sigma24 family protein